MDVSRKLLIPLASIALLTGCAGNIKHSAALDNLPDDPSYFAPDAKISKNSKLLPRNVKVRKAPSSQSCCR